MALRLEPQLIGTITGFHSSRRRPTREHPPIGCLRQARTDVALLAAIGRVGPNRSVRLHRSQSFFAVSLDFLAAEGAVSAPNDPCCEGRRYPVIPQECSATIAHPTSFPNADDLF
jgi:hypothetical protein